jgi:hypothetical protein
LLQEFDAALAGNRTLCDLEIHSPYFRLRNPHRLYACVSNGVTVSTEAQQVLRLGPVRAAAHCVFAVNRGS